MKRTIRVITAHCLVMALGVGIFSSVGVNTFEAEKTAQAASGEVSLKQKSGTLTISQDGARIKKDTAKIKIKKAKGVRIKKVSYSVFDKTVVKVSKKGQVTPKEMGATTVQVKVKYRYRNKNKTKLLNYKARVNRDYKHILSGLTLKYKNYATYVGGTEGINPCYDTAVAVGAEFFAWDCLSMSIADTTIAEPGKNGLVIGKKEGTTKVTITSTDDTDLSVTATLKIFADSGAMQVKDNLFYSVRAEYITAVESGWTEEEKERYIDEDGTVTWSQIAKMDFMLSQNMEKIIKTYSDIEKQPDNTPQDALNSLITTGREMKDGGDASDEKFLQVIRDKVVKPILDAKTTDELIAVSEDFVKRGISGLIQPKGFQPYNENLYYINAVIDGEKPAPDTPLFTARKYLPVVSAPFELSGYGFSNKKETKESKAFFTKVLNLIGFDSLSKKDIDAYTEFLKKYIDSYFSGGGDSDELTSWKQVDKRYSHLKIREHLENKGYQISDINSIRVNNEGALQVIDEYLSKEKNLPVLKMYLAEAATMYFIQYTKTYNRISFEVSTWLLDELGYSSVDDAVDKNMDIMIARVPELIPYDLDHIYTMTFYPENYKAQFEKLVKEYMDIYRDAISSSSYGETFKSNMLLKLDKMKTDCLYPDEETYKKYSLPYDLTTAAEGGNLADNLLSVKQYEAEMESMTIGTTEGSMAFWYPDNTLFENLPSTNNAWNDRSANRCTFFHGGVGLNGLFFSNPTDDSAVDAKNIAYMATTIGHEIGHAFDTSGTWYDADGMLTNTWGNDDKSKYSAKADKMAAIYGSLLACVDREKNMAYYQSGVHVVDEAMADLGGTEIALRLLEKKYPGRDDFVRDFYRYAAEQWMTTDDNYIMPEDIGEVLGDVHPPFRSRANGVASMMNEFYRVFDVKETDAMYVAPEDRVCLWD